MSVCDMRPGGNLVYAGGVLQGDGVAYMRMLSASEGTLSTALTNIGELAIFEDQEVVFF